MSEKITESSEHEFIINRGHNSYIVKLQPPPNPDPKDIGSFIDAIVYEESYGMGHRREVYKCLADKYTTPEKAATGVLLTWLRSIHHHGANLAKILTDLHERR